jgi:toxin HigB-1
LLPKRPRPDTPDEEWIGEIGRRGWIAVSRDARIRYSPLALSVLMECGTQLFVLVGKLTTAEAAEAFRSPPGNRLETLAGDRTGQYSIRVNDQYRLCFRWTAEGPTDVEIVDYH